MVLGNNLLRTWKGCFGEGVIVFMEKYGYTPEAKYLRSVRNWRRSVDERGLPNSVRQDLGMEFLDFILEDLIPGYLADHVYLKLTGWYAFVLNPSLP